VRLRGRAGRIIGAAAARWCVVRWCAVVATVALIGSAALLAAAMVHHHRSTQRSGPEVAQDAVEAAASAAEALLSYAPDTIDGDMVRAGSMMTGEFSTYYGRFTSDVLAPAVRDRGVTASARALRAGLIEIGPDTAKVLVYVNQETGSAQRPEPAYTSSSVVVSLAKVQGRWLVSAFEPV